jgi:hypothetical protein
MRRRRLGRLDRFIIGASPDKLENQQEIPAVDAPALTDEQQRELHRLNYRRWVSILMPEEEALRQRLQAIAVGRRQK